MRYGICLLGLALFASVAIGEPEVAKSTKTEVVKVKGYESGDQFTLEVIPGPAATEAIRIYSEPSHTLLTLIVDHTFAESLVGQMWHSRVVAEQQPRSESRTSLPEGRARLFLDRRPGSDDRIATWVFGAWPDGKVEERLVGDGVVGNGAFEFSIAVGSGGQSGPGS